MLGCWGRVEGVVGGGGREVSRVAIIASSDGSAGRRRLGNTNKVNKVKRSVQAKCVASRVTSTVSSIEKSVQASDVAVCVTSPFSNNKKDNATTSTDGSLQGCPLHSALCFLKSPVPTSHPPSEKG
ncbi:hypothetical protein O3P69_009387 [Scylla paramamosain]|uniref:Uncharacterized protein n=1 Tax=Scylla paramamosain TaxID=85552 RepID=A0AAW0SV30_SCYPA